MLQVFHAIRAPIMTIAGFAMVAPLLAPGGVGALALGGLACAGFSYMIAKNSKPAVRALKK